MLAILIAGAVALGTLALVLALGACRVAAVADRAATAANAQACRAAATGRRS